MSGASYMHQNVDGAEGGAVDVSIQRAPDSSEKECVKRKPT